MEKRQLDFNAPLLSARRYSSPRNSSELAPRKPVEKRALPVSSRPDPEPEDIIKPAAVPFHWERSPGRPKYEPKARFPNPTPTTPKLPPGRFNSGELPKLPAQRLSGPSKFYSGPADQTIFSDHARLLEKLDESLRCKDESENSGTENDEEDTYSDAINALSLNESCSVSGVSGSHGTGVRPSGTFSVDKQTRDFMMSRFLPAAKAVVVLETPQYVAKKPSVVGRKDEEIVKVKKNFVSGEITRPLVRKYGSAEVLPYYGRYGFDNEESEDDEDEKIGRVPVKKPGKKWGIIPRICSVKSSMCLLNPLPAMKSKSRPPTPTAGEERRLRRNAVSGPLDKNGRQLTPPPRKKYHSGQLSRDLRGPHDTNITNKSSIHDSSYPLLTSRDSPLRRYRSGSVSPYRNESPRSAFREASGFLGVPKEIDPKIASSRKMFNALRDVSRNHAVEKTVYVDSVRKVVEKRSCSKYTDYDEVKKDVKKTPLRPPLPKSPSESWLWRTLPSFGQSRRNSGELKGSSGGDDAKWENIVKSSNIRHDHHACYSEELIPHVSYKQSKS